MRKRLVIFSLIIVALFVFASCGSDISSDVLVLTPEQFEGLWVKSSNPHEYWRFNSDMTGVTWDETPDPETGEPEITEEESNLRFSWSVGRNLLMFAWTGVMENQNVPRYYYINYIDSTKLLGRDDYGLPFSLTRKAR